MLHCFSQVCHRAVYHSMPGPYLVCVAVEEVDTVPRVGGLTRTHPPAFETEAQQQSNVTLLSIDLC